MSKPIQFRALHKKANTMHNVIELDFNRREVTVDPPFEIPSDILPYYDDQGRRHVHYPTQTTHAPVDDVVLQQKIMFVFWIRRFL